MDDYFDLTIYIIDEYITQQTMRFKKYEEDEGDEMSKTSGLPDPFVNKFEPIQDILNKLPYEDWFRLYEFFEELFTKKEN